MIISTVAIWAQRSQERSLGFAAELGVGEFACMG
jgi:hypothetical protein